MIISYQILHEILTYDYVTGLLYWKHRPEKYFPTLKSYKQWNGAWPGKKH